MAGLGAKLFTAFSKLTAAQVNGYLMDQSIMRFATSAARDAAFGGAGEPTLAEGMTCYLDDTNQIQSYNGSAWVTIVNTDRPAVLELVKTQTVGSGVFSVAVTSAFSADYDNYRVVYSSGVAASASSVTFALTGSATGYYTAVTGTTYAGAASSISESNNSSFSFAGIATPEGNSLDVTLYNPFVVYRTGLQITGRIDIRGGGVAFSGGGFHNVASSFSGFTITSGSALTGGTIYIYGYRK